MARKQTGAAGAKRERQVRELFKSRGYVTFKSSDSAVADVIALRQPEVIQPAIVKPPGIPGTGRGVRDMWRFAEGYLIEVKGNHGSPFMNFRAPERAALKAVADKAGLVPLLVHWPPRGECRELHADEWPAVKEAA